MDIPFFSKGRPRMIRQCIERSKKHLAELFFCCFFFSTSKENEKTSTYRATTTRSGTHHIAYAYTSR